MPAFGVGFGGVGSATAEGSPFSTFQVYSMFPFVRPALSFSVYVTLISPVFPIWLKQVMR